MFEIHSAKDIFLDLAFIVALFFSAVFLLGAVEFAIAFIKDILQQEIPPD